MWVENRVDAFVRQNNFGLEIGIAKYFFLIFSSVFICIHRLVFLDFRKTSPF